MPFASTTRSTVRYRQTVETCFRLHTFVIPRRRLRIISSVTTSWTLQSCYASNSRTSTRPDEATRLVTTGGIGMPPASCTHLNTNTAISGLLATTKPESRREPTAALAYSTFSGFRTAANGAKIAAMFLRAYLSIDGVWHDRGLSILHVCNTRDLPSTATICSFLRLRISGRAVAYS